MDTHARTDVGRQRETNEDTVLATTLTPDIELVAVADGMGGHQSGEIASQAALEEFESYLERHIDAGVEYPDLLCDAAETANEELQVLAEANSELNNMGTTLVAALVQDGTATLVNVGDSRGYHVTDEGIEQVTTDHSLVQELVANGNLTEEEARDHPQRNVITQSLGPSGDITPDTYTVEMTGTLLLCSDGLTEEVREGTIENIVHRTDSLPEIADQLVTRANENGGSDNVSVVLAG